MFPKRHAFFLINAPIYSSIDEVNLLDLRNHCKHFFLLLLNQCMERKQYLDITIYFNYSGQISTLFKCCPELNFRKILQGFFDFVPFL